MNRYLYQVVNAGLAGEPEHLIFQNPETLERVLPEDILYTYGPDLILREPVFPDDLIYVLTYMNHRCLIEHGFNDAKL